MFKVHVERLDVTGSRILGTVEFNALSIQEAIDKATGEADPTKVTDINVYDKYGTLVKFTKLLPKN